MAQIQNLNLEITDAGPSKKKVKVTGELKFTQAEVNKKFGMKIRLFGDDSSEGNLMNAPIYTFLFGGAGNLNSPTPQALYKSVTAASTIPVNEERQVASDKLDEDPGIKNLRDGPHRDEIYALVTLFNPSAPSTTIVSKRSPTVTGLFF